MLIPIEEIEVIEDFKYIAAFGYQEVYDTPHSIEQHCRSNHDWNTSKGNMNALIYWHISNSMGPIIHTNDLSFS